MKYGILNEPGVGAVPLFAETAARDVDAAEESLQRGVFPGALRFFLFAFLVLCPLGKPLLRGKLNE